MAASVGDRIPSVETLRVLNDEGAPTPVNLEEVLPGKKVVMFAVPGAFTPGCSLTHLPGYVVNYDNLKAKGVDEVICVSVNDAWTMGAWGKAQNAENIMMLADGSGELAAALGLTLDLNEAGLGNRSTRYAMIIDDGVITHTGIEPGGEITVSSAESILEAL
jgi:glutaredoxin/glutathione-dependent peroxiredoxin